jgi:hypothetical protein
MGAGRQLGTDRYCGREVQLAEESGRAGSLRPATPVSPSTAVRRRSVLCCPLSEPNNVLVSSRSSIDAPDTTLPLLLFTMRAPFRCLFMHAQLHHPFCTTGLRTTAPTARHTQCSSNFSWPTGSACWRLAHVAGKGRGQGVTYSTEQLTRGCVYLARDEVVWFDGVDGGVVLLPLNLAERRWQSSVVYDRCAGRC